MAKLKIPLRKAWIGLANFVRRRRQIPPYLFLALSGEIGEFPPPRPQLPFARYLMPAEPANLSSLRRQFEQLALDPRVQGLVLKIECVASGATFQSLRQMLLDFRAHGKRVIAWGHSFGPFQYYLACACDQIVMPPSGEWSVIGLLREYTFFKDALEQLGVGIEVINVSPFKSAFDQFVRTDFSAESRAQAEWLLNAQFDELVRGIAAGRKLSEDQVRGLIDAAPYGAREAVEHGLLDAALYEDELEAFVSPPPSTQPGVTESGKEQKTGPDRSHPARACRILSGPLGRCPCHSPCHSLATVLPAPRAWCRPCATPPRTTISPPSSCTWTQVEAAPWPLT